MANFHPSHGTRKKPLVDRIVEELQRNGGRMLFADLARALWPDKRSHRYQSNGGPPGCYMALSAGLRRAKIYNAYEDDGTRFVTLAGYRP